MTTIVQAFPRRHLLTGRVILRGAAAIALTGAILGLLVPMVSGAPWASIAAVIRGIPAPTLIGLGLLWFVGLWLHTFVLTGALPELTHRRALALNLTGSAVANAVPFGGAAGVATNLAMTRAWGISDQRFAAYTIVTNVWNVLAKLIPPALIFAALLATGHLASSAMQSVTVVGVVAALLVVGATVGALVSEAVTFALVALARRLPFCSRVTDLEERMLSIRGVARTSIAAGWRQMSLGMSGYVILQAVLFIATLQAVGAQTGIVVLLAGFAMDRLLSLALITPGGTGVSEAGAIAVMVALGAAPLPTAAGVLLYRLFIFLLEIPVGGAVLAGWWMARRPTARRAR